ncbi:MAG TPA: NIL domain-containing protein [Planctomycetota bacterium]|nr:NIL domain-containing protein [Planctomycetota bacterium]
MKTKRFIHFEFDQDLVKEPLLYRLSRTFADVEVNIRGASVTTEGGYVALELQGEPQGIERVLDYLRERNITVIEDNPPASQS